MKKYLINGAMALIVGGFIVSCSHDDISQPATVDQMTKSFDEMFTELYGPIAPNHNWGFETVAAEEGEDEATETEAAGTRTAYTNSNMWESDGLTVPAAITPREYEVVMNYFRTTPNPQSETVDIHNYFIQNVGYTDHTYPGEGVELKDNNGHDVTITNPGRTKMDYIFVGPGANENGAFTWNEGDDHVNNFNANSGEIQYIKYSGSEWFGFHDSNGTGYSTEGHGNNGKYCKKNRNFVIRFIEVDGVVGCYVGFNYESGKTSESWHLEPDAYFDDRVIKLVAADLTPSTPDAKQETTTTETRQFKEIVDLGRVFVEDIATAYMKVTDDIDYNDIVFDARVWRIWNQIDTKVNGKITKTIKETNVKYQYDINLLATGGTIEEKVNGVDVHNKFGVGQAFMVNTWTSFCNQSLSGQWNTPTNLIMPKDFSYTLTYDELPIDPKDDSKRLAGINTIPIELRYNTKEMINLSSKVIGENGKTASAPYKLCLPVGTQWPIERRRIDHAYPKFVDYVSNPNTDFTQDLNVDSLYPAPTSKIQSDFNKGLVKGTTVLVSESSSSSTVDVVWDKEVTANNTSIKLYNFTFKSGQTLRFYGSGTIRVLDKNNSLIFDNFTMSKYLDIENISGSQAASLNGGTIKINGDNFKLTKIVVLKK